MIVGNGRRKNMCWGLEEKKWREMNGRNDGGKWMGRKGGGGMERK